MIGEKRSKSHVEVALTRRPNDLRDVQNKVREYLLSHADLEFNSTLENPQNLESCVEFIQLDEHYKASKNDDADLQYHFYKINERGAEIEMLESNSNESSEEVASSNHWLLPAREFVGLWESLIYEEGLKDNILKYVESTLLFSQHKVNPNIIACNRIVLLHGPPGTGKTSLCKAVAQKLSIRMSERFKYTHLVEINSHSLFSKWFSESGKLVMKLFAKIKEIVEHPQSLVCVLIDEVESIAYARSSVSGDEPRDALRVVNAVLTQLDQIRKHPNVLILTTSNLTSTIDCAFIDRADIKLFIGFPTVQAIYDIYLGAIQELIRVKIIESSSPLLPYSRLTINQIAENHSEHSNESLKLFHIANSSIGLSGRTLRKIPFLAHSLLVENNDIVKLSDFIDALSLALKKYQKDIKTLKTGGAGEQLNGRVS